MRWFVVCFCGGLRGRLAVTAEGGRECNRRTGEKQSERGEMRREAR